MPALCFVHNGLLAPAPNDQRTQIDYWRAAAQTVESGECPVRDQPSRLDIFHRTHRLRFPCSAQTQDDREDDQVSTGILRRRLHSLALNRNRPQVDPSWEMLPKPPFSRPAATECNPRGKRRFVSVSMLQQECERGGPNSHPRLAYAHSVAFHVCFHSPRVRARPIRA
jgi:hypothetical protein